MLKSELVRMLNEFEGDYEVLKHVEGTLSNDYTVTRCVVTTPILYALERETKQHVKMNDTILIL